MPEEVMFILVIVSMAIWITVSREAAKPSKEINWRKMITLLSAGSLSAIVISVTLFQSLSLQLDQTIFPNRFSIWKTYFYFAPPAVQGVPESFQLWTIKKLQSYNKVRSVNRLRTKGVPKMDNRSQHIQRGIVSITSSLHQRTDHKLSYEKIKADIGKILRQLCERKGVDIIEAKACPDHIHMLVSIPPSWVCRNPWAI